VEAATRACSPSVPSLLYLGLSKSGLGLARSAWRITASGAKVAASSFVQNLSTMVQTSFEFKSEQPAFQNLAAPLGESSHLVGQLSADGSASLQAVEIAASGSTSESGSEEDYDAIQTNPATIMEGAKGSTSFSVAPPGPTRLRSIPFTLNKLEEKGKYALTADKDALREILKMSIERVSRVSLDVDQLLGADFRRRRIPRLEYKRVNSVTWSLPVVSQHLTAVIQLVLKVNSTGFSISFGLELQYLCFNCSWRITRNTGACLEEIR
jgi:hypothetical protein